MLGRGRASGGCAAMEDGAEGSVEAALWRWRSRAWRPWWAPAVEVAMEDGAVTVDPKEKGAVTAIKVGDEGRWRMEESLPPWRREPLPSIRRRELPPLSRKEEAAPSRPTSSLPASSQRLVTSHQTSSRRR
jgi:hypothetical protein